MSPSELRAVSILRTNLSPNGLAWVDTNNNYIYAEHLQRLQQALLDVEAGKIKRLAIFMPPRHGKSELTSKYFPAWYLGRHPDCRIILCSYEADFAADWGSKVRNLLQEYGDLFETPIMVDRASSARNRWDIYGHKGGMQTAGVGGPITGKGAKILIIDDPVKNAEQANSATYREKAKDWFNSTAYTRLEPDGAVILIQTRWHEDDLGGWLLSDSKEDWTIIDLPAISDDGKPLWPDRFSIDDLNRIKEQVGSYWWSAMYQQRPQPAEGGILKRDWLRYYDPEDNWEFKNSLFTTYTGWDLAISEKQTADYTVSCTVKVNPVSGNMYIVDWTQDHISAPDTLNKIQEMYNRYNPLIVGIEDVAYQRSMIQFAQKAMVPAKAIARPTDKVSRITSSFTAFEQGLVFIPENHPLRYTFENEYTSFPTGKHDDLLDATEIAIQLARYSGNYKTESKQFYKYTKGAGHKRRVNTNKRRR